MAHSDFKDPYTTYCKNPPQATALQT